MKVPNWIVGILLALLIGGGGIYAATLPRLLYTEVYVNYYKIDEGEPTWVHKDVYENGTEKFTTSGFAMRRESGNEKTIEARTGEFADAVEIKLKGTGLVAHNCHVKKLPFDALVTTGVVNMWAEEYKNLKTPECVFQLPGAGGPAPEQPGAGTVNGKPRRVAGDSETRFEKGEAVLAAYIRLDNGQEFITTGCFIPNVWLGGIAKGGVINYWTGETQGKQPCVP